MQENSAFSSEETKKLRNMLQIDEIKQLKLLYAHYMDNGNIEGLANLYTEDAVCEFGPYGKWEGRENIRRNYQEVYDGLVQNITPKVFGSQHFIANHLVELTGRGTAVGRSYLLDVLTTTPKEGQPILWFGLYDEQYEQVCGSWKMKRCCLQFLWPERQVTEKVLSTFPPK